MKTKLTVIRPVTKEITFKDIPVGTIFALSGRSIWIKIKPMDHQTTNCISFNGIEGWMNDDNHVEVCREVIVNV